MLKSLSKKQRPRVLMQVVVPVGMVTAFIITVLIFGLFSAAKRSDDISIDR